MQSVELRKKYGAGVVQGREGMERKKIGQQREGRMGWRVV